MPLAVDGKMVLMHYMPWYKTPEKRGAWGSHWTGHQREHNPDNIKENGLPDIWAHYHPLIGLYDSTDPDVVECHLLQMKLAGVHGVIADWYGIGNTADYPEIHEATQVLFDACAKLGMLFAVCYEDRTVQLKVEWKQLQPDQTTNHLAETFQWMQDNWFNQPHYVRLDDRPLVLNFGPIYLKEKDIWAEAMKGLPTKPHFFALHHLWRIAGADGGFTWIHHEPWDGPQDRDVVRTRIGEVFRYFTGNPDEVLVSAYPGYQDVYGANNAVLDHRNGDVLRDTLHVGLNGPWKIIQIATWNDYGESTMIEPTHEFGYTFLEIVQQSRIDEPGSTFKQTPDALRLPAQLLALRKSATADANRLDELSYLLAQGLTEIAALEMQQVTP